MFLVRCVEDVAARQDIAQRLHRHASTIGDWAGGSEDFGERRANAKRAGVPPPQFGFEANGDCRWLRTRDEESGSGNIGRWMC